MVQILRNMDAWCKDDWTTTTTQRHLNGWKKARQTLLRLILPEHNASTRVQLRLILPEHIASTKRTQKPSRPRAFKAAYHTYAHSTSKEETAVTWPIFAVLRRTDYKIESDEPLSIAHMHCAHSPLKEWIWVFLDSGSITFDSFSSFFHDFPYIHHYQINPFCIQFAHSQLNWWIWVVLPKARRVSEKHNDAQKVSRKDTTTRQLARSPLKL